MAGYAELKGWRYSSYERTTQRLNPILFYRSALMKRRLTLPPRLILGRHYSLAVWFSDGSCAYTDWNLLGMLGCMRQLERSPGAVL